MTAPIGALPNAPLFTKVSVAGNRLSAKVNPALYGRYVRDEFFAEYSPEFDLALLPPSVQIVPALFNIAPVAWLSGMTFEVPELDDAVSETLIRTKAALESMYPHLDWSGQINPLRRSPPGPLGGPGHDEGTPTRLALFSGGLDSVCTSLRHQKHKQLLVSVWGADVALSDEHKWRNVAGWTRDYAARFGHDTAFVRSNLRSFLNEDYLNNFSDDITNWWGGVQHGLGLTGLTAPLATHLGTAEVLIAASHSTAFHAPWGSHPTIDNHIGWQQTRVAHDGFELTRMGKLAFCRDYFRNTNSAPALIRVCYAASSNDGENCCKCEKCLRTMAALIVLDEDPCRWGFKAPIDEAMQRIRNGFLNHEFKLGANGVYMWQDIQTWAHEAQSRMDASRIETSTRLELIDWFAQTDFSSWLDQELRPNSGFSRVKRFAKVRFPRITSLLRRLMRGAAT